MPATGATARVGANGFDQGEVELADRRLVCLFNRGDEPRPCQVLDFWTGERLGQHREACEAGTLPPHGARARMRAPERA